MKHIIHCGAFAVFFASASLAAAATLVASYDFDNSLAANESGVPALEAIDPLGLNVFETAAVNGQSRTVYRWSGNGISSLDNAGFKLKTTGLLTYNDYSVALTFEFLSPALFGGGWRRIMDFENRQSDSGFYVSPVDNIQAVQVPAIFDGTTEFTTPGFHNVLLTVSPDGARQRVKAYLDGNLELAVTTDFFSLDNANNPGNLLHFFVDNTSGGAQQEFANGRIASLKIFSGEVDPGTLPEPQSALLLLTGACALWGGRRRG